MVATQGCLDRVHVDTYLQARFLDQLVMVHGQYDYLRKRARMRCVNGHTHADW